MTILLNIFFMYTSLTGKAQVVTSNMQLQAVLCGLSVALLMGCAYGGTTNREGKAISLFNLVKFDNDVCAGRSEQSLPSHRVTYIPYSIHLRKKIPFESH